MPPAPGQTLLHYRFVEKLGEGGMGVVWKALDTTLDREVAIKLLPEIFAADADRLARFEREAKLLASLNHPNIAAVYGLYPSTGSGQAAFVAMELVPGENLAARIARGPLSVEESIDVARQVAEALETAHDNGVIHRDLKPANIQVTPDGRVKVLDFGLAKAFAPDPASGSRTTPTMSPTVTSAGTAAGVILGTAAYMSPEQARGKPVDRRADIWALGSVLYEMLTGQRLFQGETISDTLAAVLRADVNLDALPADTPATVRRLIARCLDRDPRSRLRDAGEARIVLAAPGAAEAPTVERTPAARPRQALVAAGLLLALVAGIAIGRVLLAPGSQPVPAFVFNIEVPGHRIEMGMLALSPDGTQLAFLVRRDDGMSEIWIRDLASDEARPLPGTRGAAYPFWSPDSRELAFFADGGLLRMSLDGAAPRPIATTPRAMGGSWGADGTIIYGSEDDTGIFRIPAAGGVNPVAMTTPEQGVEDTHVWPTFLPDGRQFVFLADASTDDGHRIYLASIDGGTPKLLKKGVRSSFAVDPAGYLLLVRENQLVAHRFDLRRHVVDDDALLVADGVHPFGTRHLTPFTLAATGVLALQKGSGSSRLLHLDFEGNLIRELAEPDSFGNIAVSSDGRHVAFELYGAADEALIWVLDVERGVRTAVSQRGAHADFPTWAADGRTLFFDADVGTSKHGWSIFRGPADGSSQPTELGGFDSAEFGPFEASPDGKWLLVGDNRSPGGWDLLLVPVAGGMAQAIPWLSTPAREFFGSFSPDSRWIAYTSDSSGASQVYVAAVDGASTGGQRLQISSDGGLEPRFSADGKRIYYRSRSGKLMEVDLDLSATRMDAGVPRALFDLEGPQLVYERNTFAMAPDGNGIIALRAIDQGGTAVSVRTSWRDSLR